MRNLKIAGFVLVAVLIVAAVAIPLYGAVPNHRASAVLTFSLLGGMAIKIKSADQIATKFATRGAAAAGDYAQGVQNPRRDWQSATAGAESSYNQGVQDAIGRGSFKKGVNSAGNDKYQRKAAGVGAQRFAPGITAAKQDYQTGVQPYLDTLANLSLPPRAPKGSPQNVQRVQAVADALRAKKLAG